MNLVEGTTEGVEYSHLNVAGLSLWYQMTNKPDFYQTFQALLTIRQQFVEEFFLKNVAYQAYHYFFKNEQVVEASVLGFLDPKIAQQIYNDEFFGMNAPSKLFYWFSALQGKQGSRLYNFI